MEMEISVLDLRDLHYATEIFESGVLGCGHRAVAAFVGYGVLISQMPNVYLLCRISLFGDRAILHFPGNEGLLMVRVRLRMRLW
jgi:hypothetical protein